MTYDNLVFQVCLLQDLFLKQRPIGPELHHTLEVEMF